MRAIVQLQAGEPSSSMELRSVPEPGSPASGNVVIAVDLASVHHGDLFFARRPKQLAPGEEFFTTGTEGVGRITRVADDVASGGEFQVGDRVAVFMASGTWAEQIEVPTIQISKVPDDFDDTLAAQLFVNTLTATLVLRTLKATVPPERLADGMVLLTGASTAVARILARLMLEERLALVALTRSETSAKRTHAILPEVSYFATANEGWKDEVAEATGGRPIVAVADCVSGAFISQISPLLADDAAIITYGGLDNEPVGLTGLEITSRQLEVRGVTVGRWLTETSAETQAKDLEATVALGRTHPELFTVAETYNIDDWKSAVHAVEEPGREGFVFLKP